MFLAVSRTVNVELIRSAIESRGHHGWEKLALETQVVTVFALAKVLSSKRAPNPLAQEAISRVLQQPVDVVFPPIPEKPRRKKAA